MHSTCYIRYKSVTNPTQYTKLTKQIVKHEIRLLLGIRISRIFCMYTRNYMNYISTSQSRSRLHKVNITEIDLTKSQQRKQSSIRLYTTQKY